MPRRSILEDDDNTEINLSPMIDCIFILLIFFIVTTVFVEEAGTQVHKPDAAAISTPDQKENVTLEITAENQVLLGKAPIPVADIPAAIKSAVQDPEIPVVIRSHEDADHGVFVSVWDAARRGGAQTLSFSTVN